MLLKDHDFPNKSFRLDLRQDRISFTFKGQRLGCGKLPRFGSLGRKVPSGGCCAPQG